MAKGTRYTPEFKAKAVKLLTESRGCRMFRSGPVSRMAARRETPARDILETHADSFMAVYGYRKTHARSSARGRDRPRPGDERHAGIGSPRRAPRRDARRRQTGEGHGPRGTRVRGVGAEPAARGRRRPRAHGQRLVRPHGVRRRRVRPHDRRPGVRHQHGHRGSPPRALEQAISWAAPHGGADDPVRRSGHGARRIGLVHATGAGEFGTPPPTGTVGDSYGNAMAGGTDGACRTEPVRRRKPFQDSRDPELATFRRASRRGPESSAPALGPQDTGTDRNRVSYKPSGASRPAIGTEQKSGHISI